MLLSLLCLRYLFFGVFEQIWKLITNRGLDGLAGLFLVLLVVLCLILLSVVLRGLLLLRWLILLLVELVREVLPV
ncbi:hypothetical protein BKG86_01925 [Mycobacteroides chelonae]|nr:hypothetical protein BKG86_01925 [Mycobacteroides chelonae]